MLRISKKRSLKNYEIIGNISQEPSSVLKCALGGHKFGVNESDATHPLSRSVKHLPYHGREVSRMSAASYVDVCIVCGMAFTTDYEEPLRPVIVAANKDIDKAHEWFMLFYLYRLKGTDEKDTKHYPQYWSTKKCRYITWKPSGWKFGSVLFEGEMYGE